MADEQNNDNIQWRIELQKKLKWLLLSRLVILILLFAAITIFLAQYQFLFKLFVVYGFITLGYLSALYFWRIARKEFSFAFLYGIELFFEILMETAIIHFTGGEASPFTFLYMLTILSSAFFYDLPGTVLTATGAALAYSALTYLRFNEITEPVFIAGSSIAHRSSDMTFAIAYIQVCFLYIVAFLSGYLSRKIRAHLGELEETKQRLERAYWNTDQIIQHMRNGLVTVDEYGTILYFNPSASRILQLPEEIVMGKRFENIFPDRLNSFTDCLKQALKSPTVQRTEIEITNRYGQNIPLALAINTLRINQEIHGAIALFEDITEEKKRDELLQQMEKLAAIGELSARLAHELRNPLATIRGGVEMLTKQNQDEKNSVSKLILKESDRLTDILESFLIFARLKELPPEYFRTENINICSLVNEIVEEFRTAYDTLNINFIIELPPQLVIIGKKDQLKQVFQNLFKNSMESIGDNPGEIRISTAGTRTSLFTKEELVGISVVDNGKGIPKENVQKIFEPFFTDKPKGTGLGLSIVQGIVNQHGGYIEVNRDIDNGAEFIIYLPKSDSNRPNTDLTRPE